jgi:hypothetical protein
MTRAPCPRHRIRSTATTFKGFRRAQCGGRFRPADIRRCGGRSWSTRRQRWVDPPPLRDPPPGSPGPSSATRRISLALEKRTAETRFSAVINSVDRRRRSWTRNLVGICSVWKLAGPGGRMATIRCRCPPQRFSSRASPGLESADGCMVGGWEAEDQRCKRSSWTQDGGSEGLGELVPSRWFRDGCGELGAGFCWVTASRD